MNILFIGNSFTYFNCLTGVFWETATANGHPVHVEELTVGGYYLRQYLDPKDKHGLAAGYKLRQDPFDIVVLQDQSANPALHPEEFLDTAAAFCERIRAIGATPCFYQTWSYRDGSEKLQSTGMTYDGFYEALRDSYEKAAKENSALLAPVGTAFRKATRELPGIDLLSKEDDYHPSPAGTFLSMCTFYRTLFGEAPEKIVVPEGLTKETCRALLALA